MFFWSNLICIEHCIWIPVYGQFPFENNCKWTVNCLVTPLLCEERCATMDKFSWELLIYSVLPTLRFSHEFGLVFLWSCVFLNTCGLLLIEISLFLGLFFVDFYLVDCFFFKFYGTFSVLIYCQRQVGRFFAKICSFSGCFFGCVSLFFYLIFLPIFFFAEFSCQTHVGVFRLNYLFWPCFSNLLAYFCKITWHHCIYCYVTEVHREAVAPARMREQMDISVTQASNCCI